MKTMSLLLAGILLVSAQPNEQTQDETKLRQYYSGKFGFYQPGEGLNNGLLLGVDGITEFVKYNIGVSGSIDLYQKQSFDFFHTPKPQVQQQAIILLPLHANIGYKLAEVADADLRIFIGAGGGYYFYFYSVEYRNGSGGGILTPGSFTSTVENKNGGDLFATAFLRILFGKVFVEPRFYFASSADDAVGAYRYTVNPSGFAITLGFQQ
jgi:hypothetical protein